MLALTGTVWPGGDATTFAGTVLVDDSGTVVACAPEVAVPESARRLAGWVGPGIVDAHVHLAFGTPADMLAGGVVGLRDLGAPPLLAVSLRQSAAPVICTSGPILTAPDGYPSRSWGAAGFASFVGYPAAAEPAVRALAADGATVIKVALEPGGGAPVPSLEVTRAIVRAAHEQGLPVTAHALTAAMVTRALDAGVDELAHTPTEPLPDPLVERIAAAGIGVVSTLQTFFAAGEGADAVRNAAALVRAGVPLRYGTDLGNAGTRTGVDPRELDRLADAGLGRLGALRAATEGAAAAAGMTGCSGRIVVGEPAAVVVLPGDPLAEPELWRAPTAVITPASPFST